MKLSKRIAMPLLPIVLLSGCQDGPADAFDKARLSFAQEDYAAASNAAMAALRAQPDNRQLLQLLAESQLRAGDIDGASLSIDRLERADVDRQDIARMRAELALLKSSPKDAFALVGNDMNPASRYARAEALRLLDREDEAAAIFEQGLAEGKDTRLAAAYARMRLLEGDVAATRRILQRMREFAPKAYATRVLAGDLADAEGQPDAAIAAFTGVVEDFPERLEPIVVLATLLDQQGKAKMAQAFLEKAEAIAPDDERILPLKIRLLSDQGKWQDIREALQGRESSLVPASSLGLSYGEALLRLGQPEQARVLFSRAALMRPENPYVRMLLGEAELTTGDAEAAWETLQPLTAMSDAPPELFALAGKAARAVGDPSASALEARGRGTREKAGPG